MQQNYPEFIRIEACRSLVRDHFEVNCSEEPSMVYGEFQLLAVVNSEPIFPEKGLRLNIYLYFCPKHR